MIKKFAMITVLALAAWAMLLLVVFVGLGIYGELAEVREGDATFNCYVMGNLTCGDTAPWHGFTGAAPDEPVLKCREGFRVETINGVDNITCGHSA